jgi:ribosomal protein L21
LRFGGLPPKPQTNRLNKKPGRISERGNEHEEKMFAVIKTGGKQYRVAAEDKIKVEKIAGEPGEIIQFGEVLVVGGDSVTLGSPTVSGASVAGVVVGAEPRPEGHRVQEAPAQEFPPQARPPAGIHPGADHRDPHRRGETLERKGRGEAEGRKAQGKAGGRAAGSLTRYNCQKK